MIEKIKSRKEYNLYILDKLKTQLEENPELRFGQVVSNMFSNHGIDMFYEEPVDTYNRCFEEEYYIQVTRSSTKTYKVKAHNYDEAYNLILDLTVNEDWSKEDAEYKCSKE